MYGPQTIRLRGMRAPASSPARTGQSHSEVLGRRKFIPRNIFPVWPPQAECAVLGRTSHAVAPSASGRGWAAPAGAQMRSPSGCPVRNSRSFHFAPHRILQPGIPPKRAGRWFVRSPSPRTTIFFQCLTGERHWGWALHFLSFHTGPGRQPNPRCLTRSFFPSAPSPGKRSVDA